VVDADLMSDKAVVLGAPIKETGLSTGVMKISYTKSLLLHIRLLYSARVTQGSHFVQGQAPHFLSLKFASPCIIIHFK